MKIIDIFKTKPMTNGVIRREHKWHIKSFSGGVQYLIKVEEKANKYPKFQF